MKSAACDPKFLQHSGPAVVFDSYDEMIAEIDRDDIDITADHVLVLRNSGPKGGPGMPEWGMLPIPKKLLQQGVRDMLRLSDCRMSGTSYGACVLHIAPESFIGGPLALVENGDIIEVDVAERRLDVKVSEEELKRRRSLWKAPKSPFIRGYNRMYIDHVNQAHEGCDFDYLEFSDQDLPEPEIH